MKTNAEKIAAWLEARCGIVTAPMIGNLITPTLKVANNETSHGIIETLLAERLTGREDAISAVKAYNTRSYDDISPDELESAVRAIKTFKETK